MHLQLWYLPTIILLCFWQYYNHEQNQVFDNLKKFSSIGISQTEPFVNSELDINFFIESFLFLFFVFSFFSNTNFTEKTVSVSGIRTKIVADNVTTTTALISSRLAVV